MPRNGNKDSALPTLDGPKLGLRLAFFERCAKQPNLRRIACKHPITLVHPTNPFEVPRNRMRDTRAEIDIQFAMPVANLATQRREADPLGHFVLLASAVDGPVDVHQTAAACEERIDGRGSFKLEIPSSNANGVAAFSTIVVTIATGPPHGPRRNETAKSARILTFLRHNDSPIGSCKMNSPSQWFAVSLAFAWLSTDAPGGHSAEPFAVSIQVDAASDLGELKPIWRFFGADEPNYAYMPNGSKLISHLGQLSPKQVLVSWSTNG